MASALPSTPGVSARPRTRGGGRRRALVHLLDDRLRGHFAAQVAKLLAILTAVGYAALAVAVSVSGAAHEAIGVVVKALFWLSWIGGGGVALAATGAGRSSDDEGVLELAAQRGFDATSIALARTLAVGRRTLRVAGFPALAVALVALASARSLDALAARGLLLVAVGVYVGILASVAALLVALSRTISKDRARWALVLLVLLPHAARSLWPHVPSIPALFDNLLDAVNTIGVGR